MEYKFWMDIFLNILYLKNKGGFTMDWREILKKKKQRLENLGVNFEGKILDVKSVKEVVNKRPRKGMGFRSLVGKEIIIRKIEFQGDKAIVEVEVDDKKRTVQTSDQNLIKRWLIDFKLALDMGAEGIKVKVAPYGVSGVKFV
jgi:hypothetical protein